MGEKSAAKKDYVVVFDQLGVPTGEYAQVGPGQHPMAISEDYFRGDTVSLTEADAQRHLDSGAIIPKSDRRAKLIQPNPAAAGGVKRDPGAALAAVQLEQAQPATAGGDGAKRTADGKLGTKAELEKLSVTELKQLAEQHNVTVERGDTKPKLAAKLAKVKVADSGADDELNPGQESGEQSPPPETQPEDE